ncbi:hypothetical protein D9611_013670 [Ephemerocybe angulata]|uniref:Uncharacterized protein n=1 Tax=Ephemerocybe angulata TaxID=980116 RepID=A0A8H5B8U0_9AGAR|nr:hypothetical protein D9611_013670 [Tulosesus angulatus]
MALPMVIRALIGISLQAMPPLAVVSGEEGRPVPAARRSALPQSLSHLQPTHRGARPLRRASLATRTCGRLPVFFGRRSCCPDPGEGDDHLDTIAEWRQASKPASQADAESRQEPPPSLASQLLVLIIVQYGVMALHTTTHGQIFTSYLVCDYESGGLNLNAGHFAQLIALMCFV